MSKDMLDNIAALKIDLLLTDKRISTLLKEVSVLNINDGNGNFHPDGLFSTEIFGDVGSSNRMQTLGYVDLKIKILSPIVYKFLISLNKLYKDIMEAKKFAIWDDKVKDFIESDKDEAGASTGFNFFIKKVKDIKFKDNDSDSRKTKINIINSKTADELLIDKMIVIPAGMRDHVVSEDGKPSEDEINPLYRKLMINSNALKNINTNGNLNVDTFRTSIQKAALDIYAFIFTLIDGKNKHIQGSFLKRAIDDSTRNVLTSSPFKPTSLEDAKRVGENDTIMGLYQFSKALFPFTKYGITNGIISKIFNDTNRYSTLFNFDKKITENVEVKSEDINKWTSREGINATLNRLGNDDLAKEPIRVGDHFLLAVWDDGKTIKLVFDTNKLDKDKYDYKYLRPITYIELVYLSVHQHSKKENAFFTRYPVGTIGGVYPTKLYLKTTIQNRKVDLVDEMGDYVITLFEYPNLKARLYNTMSPHYSKLARLVADFDGDQSTATALFTKDSNDEINNMMSTAAFYIAPDGTLISSIEDQVIKNLINTFMAV